MNEKYSFLEILNLPDKQKVLSSTKINVLKDDAMSLRSNSTSKIDLNKFKITKNNESKSLENIINKIKLELNTNQQSIVTGEISPITQTIDNLCMSNFQNGNTLLNITPDNFSRKNNFSKYFIIEGSNKVLSRNNRSSNNLMNNSIIPNRINSQIEIKHLYKTSDLTYNFLTNNKQTNQIKSNMNKFKIAGSVSKTSNDYNNITSKEKQDVESKVVFKNIQSLLSLSEIQSRRMTLEFIK